ncbi:hypothetical protein ATCV1_z433L [Acanthocystis turfacea chlorella virus 1]|uniref:Uncharacterized protein z433L n=1 Tax=Chlorovirus heliozoae TaxID=322019 RepID=A7K943_9PHYC|nr:hypothetical protein ATCV1_z433L [Acanthocystis turfacea chlorella virus 1]ABT16567.1 hypothetical protein ATCV1_z433L [Acanthocystis turfacea chlorella virus 1]
MHTEQRMCGCPRACEAPGATRRVFAAASERKQQVCMRCGKGRCCQGRGLCLRRRVRLERNHVCQDAVS